MPHVTVDYAAEVGGDFDRRAFVRELEPLVVTGFGSAGVCKVLFRPAGETFVGGEGGARFAHVGIGVLPGRSEARKGRLAEAVLALLGKHLPDAVLSVEVRDLAPAYRLLTPARP